MTMGLGPRQLISALGVGFVPVFSPYDRPCQLARAAQLFSPAAAVWLSAMIAISCFSAAATCTLSGARVYLAMAQDGVFFKRMAVIHPKWRTPAFSLIG